MCEACCWLEVASPGLFGPGVKPRTSPDEKGTGISTVTDVVTGVLYATARVAVKSAAMLNLMPSDSLHTCSMLMQLTLSDTFGVTPSSLPPQMPER